METVVIFVFDQFETLDAFGPAEIFGKHPDLYRLQIVSPGGGLVASAQTVSVDTIPASSQLSPDILIVPGGLGTRTLVDDTAVLNQVFDLASRSRWCLSVCTGAALLAKTTLLNGRLATTNKRAFDWVASLNDTVRWQRSARWTVDGPFYTSSGVSAGMDMSLGFLRDRHGPPFARATARMIEYIWNADSGYDPLSRAP